MVVATKQPPHRERGSDMPIEHHMGVSVNTKTKQEHLKHIINTHISICEHIINKNSWASRRYLWIDMNAGKGAWDPRPDDPQQEPINGSPLVFLNAMMKRPTPFVAFFIDNHKANCDTLRQFTDLFGNSTSVRNGDNKHELIEISNELRRNHYGMVYSDENAMVPFDTLAKFSEKPQCQRVDILVHMPATTLKRVRSAYPDRHKQLQDEILGIKKKYWIVREPVSRHQWTFLIGTNWEAFPQFRRHGFHRLNSKDGREVFLKLNHTQQEMGFLTHDHTKTVQSVRYSQV